MAVPALLQTAHRGEGGYHQHGRRPRRPERTAQWALDQHDVLRHDLFWNNQIMRVMQYNTQLIIVEQQVLFSLPFSSTLNTRASWAAARGLNASDRDFEPLQPLPIPPALIPVPVAPPPPNPGALLALPAPFAQLYSPRHTFSSRRTRGALRGLTRPQPSTLLPITSFYTLQDN
ncbi:hypothetical protein B0H14DRAFT_3463588 [Mycena olivaceomarginata]|nr:hypothetical protein B0H14DRAFT_3463588 [Mycena olivaceomarginata]